MYKKSRKYILTFLIVSILFGCIFVVAKTFNVKSNIDRTLKSESYSYLPKEAQNFIKDLYEETGELVATEKNKQQNQPYLNPDYIEYLKLPEEEQNSVELIPDMYVLDYEISKLYSETELPSAYDLRDIDGKNYVSAIKDQGSTGICWAFASIENVETLLMKEKNQSYSDKFQKFSVRQMDYATSDAFIKDATWETCSGGGCTWIGYDNEENVSRKIGDGGNFYTSSIAMANAITLTDEKILPWNEKNDSLWTRNIIGHDKSLYEVDSTIQIPSINQDTASEELINSYVNDIKKYMIEYGGPFVGTYSPKSTCGFNNIDGTKAIKTDNCVNNSTNKNQGHAMQIIGWDDNYEYSYCESGTSHYSVDNGKCKSGELKQGKGAWILKNSWGEATEEAKAYRYIYLTYDSTRLSIGFVTSLSDMTNRKWDNNYHLNPWINGDMSKGMMSVSEQTEEFDTKNTKSEKIEKIKFLTATKDSSFTISVKTKNTEYNNIITVNTNEVGIYSVDLSEKNIVIDDNIFSVIISGKKDNKFYNNSISVFTTNIDKTPSITSKFGIKMYSETETRPSKTNPAYISGSDNPQQVFEHYTKNIPEDAKLQYKVSLDGKDYSSYFFVSSPSVNYMYNYQYVKFSSRADSIDHPVCGQTYLFEIIYNDIVLDSFPLKRICEGKNGNEYTSSEVRFHKNDGSDYSKAYTYRDLKFYSFDKVYLDNFFINDKYIASWNTKPDGTGTSYTSNEIYLYSDLDLYAQWASPHTYRYIYYCFTKNCECKTGQYCQTANYTISKEGRANYDEEVTIINPFTNINGEVFIHWHDSKDGKEVIYYEEEKANNLAEKSPYNDTYTTLSSVWSSDYNTISFDSNGGFGNMKEINVIPSTSTRIKYNLFEKTGCIFKEWNTKSDGTGTRYKNGGNINTEENLTLYAIWEPITYKITFNPNGGIGTIQEQTFAYDVESKLLDVKYTKQGYEFKEWNTKADGSGISYSRQQEIKITGNITLYAIWNESYSYKINKYKVDELNKYIDLIDINTTVEEFKNNIDLNVGYTLDVEYKSVNGKQLLYTGSKTKIYHNNVLFVEYTNIIRGDVNGNAVIDIIDYIRIMKDIMGTSKLTGAYKNAADVNQNGKIDIIDYIRIMKMIMEENS